MYVGYDSTTLGAVPADAQLILAYADGAYANVAEARRLFPHAILQTIATNAGTPADWLDVEQGDATPDEFPAWHKLSVAHGHWRPGPYANGSTWPTIDQVIAAAALQRRAYRRWLADPVGRMELTAGYDGQQCEWSPDGHHYDLSLFAAGSMPGRPTPDDHNFYFGGYVDTLTGQWHVHGLPRP